MGQKFGFSVVMGLVNPVSIHNCMRVQMSYMSKVSKTNGVFEFEGSVNIPSNRGFTIVNT